MNNSEQFEAEFSLNYEQIAFYCGRNSLCHLISAVLFHKDEIEEIRRNRNVLSLLKEHKRWNRLRNFVFHFKQHLDNVIFQFNPTVDHRSLTLKVNKIIHKLTTEFISYWRHEADSAIQSTI